MFSNLEKVKIPIILPIFAVSLFGFVCTGMTGHDSMHPSSVKPVNAAISEGRQECCNTSISKHVESWKGALLVPPREIKDGLLLLLLGLVTAFALVGLRWRHDPDDPHRLSCGLYIRDNPDIALFNQLKPAFARGILNPKIY